MRGHFFTCVWTLIVVAASAPAALAQADASAIDFGDDTSQWANDGECDDLRFTGPGMAAAGSLSADNIRRDASDCRKQLAAWRLGFRGEVSRDALAEAERLIGEASAAQQAGQAYDGVSAAERALEIREAELGPDDLQTLAAVSWVGGLYEATGRSREAELLYARAVEGFERILGPDHLYTLTSLNNLAELLQATDRLAEAAPLFERALEGRARILGDEQPETLAATNDLALLAQATARFEDAEVLLVRVLEASQRALGMEHSITLSSVNNLAEFYRVTGRFDQAEPLYLRALDARVRILGSEDPKTLRSINNLGALYVDWLRFDDAQPLLVRAVELRERVLGPDHPDTLSSLNNLASLYRATSRYAEAEPLAARALEGTERVLGPDHPNTLTSVNNLAGLYNDARRFEEAEPLFARALEGRERELGPDHPVTLRSVSNLAGLYQATGRLGEAEATQRRGIEAGVDGARRGLGGDAISEYSAGAYGEFHLALTAQLGAEAPPEARSAALLSAQLGRSSVAGEAVQSAAARLRSGDPVVADALRALDAANARIEALSAQRTAALVEGRAEDAAALGAEVDAARDDAEAALAQVPEEVRALLGAAFLEARDLQGAEDTPGLLGAGEALIAFVEASELDRLEGIDLAEAWFAVVVTPEAIAVEELDATPAEVAALVARVRGSLEIETDEDGRALPPPAFDRAAARALHAGLIAPLMTHLDGVERLLVVPDGPLQSLPLEVLLAGDAGAETWLGERFQIAVLPSVASLKSLREDAGASDGARPLLAFADPVFKGGVAARAGRQRLAARDDGGAALVGLSSADTGGVDSVCSLTQVPATARIAAAMQARFAAGDEAVILGEAATEARLRALNDTGALADARVVAFNTHGLTAAETAARGFAEPALALTPAGACGADAPEVNADPANDGFLTLSEIIDLKLDADWVLLTACNTAAADGSAGAEPLSGLARGFFYAGARAMLVSHWPAQVSQDPLRDGPTEILIRELFAPEKAGVAKSAALQDAQAVVRDAYPHPAYWAPFSLVGDGR